MAETWNDDRLDELSLRVDEGFARIDHQLHALRTEFRTDAANLRAEVKAEMRAGFDAIDKRFEATDRRLEATDRRLDSLYRVLILAVSSMLFAVIGTAIAMVVRG